MARADLIYELIKYGLENDKVLFRQAAQAISTEEKAKNHTTFASKIDELLDPSTQECTLSRRKTVSSYYQGQNSEEGLFIERKANKELSSLILSKEIKENCKKLIEEQNKAELLASYGVEPRNRILLIGPPGNGKTSLAEAIANSLNLPLITAKYDSIVGSYLGETASRLNRLFEYAQTRQCVLFFDEFETIGKERGDFHDTGEIKRVVSSLLMQIDALPSYVVVVAATNHDELLDSAVWRRFQLKIEMNKPSVKDLEDFYSQFSKTRNFDFGRDIKSLAEKTVGLSFAEVEELMLSIYREYILRLPNSNVSNITDEALNTFLDFKNKTTIK